ncbi:unannotated protein [freshwater metagenome]|uniref:Unannotated protein n=1 Tax=freshwater metagenome TaxID=449393 RepID=A0A6J7KEW9_9ZZZZ
MAVPVGLFGVVTKVIPGLLSRILLTAFLMSRSNVVSRSADVQEVPVALAING